ncbi:L,D-transpeptidase family protein [Candidatus Liberibacter americanus]|uniref:L,D-TPase catalytic domain-containing protein n=1 Tax=Candidatus Liberibacter americanus str. Sao Paulo TaxID=1261131 RepID=U6B9E1_9HYPH|nr:murein L,D-transpeptidase family protein [Candidatus Liberibacter americanus]AHA28337.1 hypothetical protein lam_1009 [Candidatus Liberibacter americanus str. Sao Paulo]EMS36627.1 hypothetical protein G653_00230 [Candidatus Liberibacter americanus PW_SP]
MNHFSLYGSFVIALLILTSGCGWRKDFIDRAEYPLSKTIIRKMHLMQTDQNYPSLIRIFKKENVLEIWKYTKNEKYVLLKSYKICAWSGKLGSKIEDGDKQSPEGFYKVRLENLNPNSQHYLSINIGFPNEFDKANHRTGKDIMIHGGCSSAGCYAMNDIQMQEIYAIIRDSLQGKIQDYVQIQSFPFRMTQKNMNIYKSHPEYNFWQIIQIGYNYFEKTNKEPIVDVFNKYYVFLKS